MRKADPFAISRAFFTRDDEWSFQYVKPVFRLYGINGAFVKEFRSFKAMNKYILKHSK